MDRGLERPAKSDPKTLGSYEIVRSLGHGGMATVFLAKREGAGGFLKWVAIKQAHPHLAQEPRFVNMFLDEARVAALLQHPNVAQVFELGDQGGEPFFVMEYLHGEHLGAVFARALQTTGRMDPLLAAYVIRAAAEGLHHSHEAHGADGQPLNIVHRDVSPQNIFVTYEGAVKLTDFGIAHSRGRLQHTRTGGGVKGKFAYMAPEQALANAVDRRADIFSLGVLLWELTVGRRLFAAATEAKTIMRVTSGKVPKPSSIVDNYPPELERILYKALSVRPSDRYGDAASMGAELDAFIAGRVGVGDLSRWMHNHFVERVEAKETILSSGGEANVEVPPEPTVVGSDGMSRRSRWESLRGRTAWAAALVMTLAALLLVWLVAGGGTGALRIDSTPPGARVWLDGEAQRSTTPLLLERVDVGEHQLRFELEGYAPEEVGIEIARGRRDLQIMLQPEATLEVEPPPIAAVAPTEEPLPEEMELPETAVPEEPPAPTTRMRARPAASGSRGEAILNLVADPWASVTINGNPVGNTPLIDQPVPAGALVIVLRAEGGELQRTLRLNATPGQVIRRRIELD